jgi:hypothetical protein
MQLVAIFGVSFLTPLGALFTLAAAAPLAALVVTERRSERVRALLGVVGPGRRTLAPVVGALVLLPLLVGVAAAQPVVVRRQLVHERGDAQAFFVFDTSRSMLARSGPGLPDRLARAKRLARRLRGALGNVPVGIASLTDRALPELMPTTDPALFLHTLGQSVGIDEPPPSQPYKLGRATSFDALVPLVTSHFYSETAHKRLLVVFTDGETSPPTPLLGLGIQHRIQPVFVHVWAPGEQIYSRAGRSDPHYTADARSAALLEAAAETTDGTVFTEHQLGRIESQARRIVGHGTLSAHVSAYARIALAPWFALGGVLPLGFLLWRRNA